MRMDRNVIRWLVSRVKNRRAAMFEAEAIVYRHDRAALNRVASIAADPDAGFEERRHCVRVLRIAIERQSLSQHVDTATRYDLQNEWRTRRGSLIR